MGIALLTTSKPSLAGDNSMGYGLLLLYLGIGFALSGLILTITIIAKGGFAWTFQWAGIRTAVLLSFWLFVGLTTVFCAIFRLEWHNDGLYPSFLHGLALVHGQLWIPLLWLIACFFTLFTNGTVPVSPLMIKVPFWVGLGVSALFSGGLLVGYLRDSIRTAEANVTQQIERDNYCHQQNLNAVIAHKPEDSLFQLLSYSSRFQADDVRQAAIAKIKAYPHWEADILELLKDERAYAEVYYFLDGNKVEHPKQFAGPLNQSIVWLSATIRADIKNSNNLQNWTFDSYKIDRLLNAVDDQFMNQGIDFYPNVVSLKQALTTGLPDRFKDIHFTATDKVNEWLRKHKK